MKTKFGTQSLHGKCYLCMFWNSKQLQHETALLEFIVTSQFHCMQAITIILSQDQENPSWRGLPLSMLRNLFYRALRVLAQGQIYHFCNGGSLIQFIWCHTAYVSTVFCQDLQWALSQYKAHIT